MADTVVQSVLVVEDEELMRSILRQLLESAGYDVITADSAESALQAYRGNDFAVTLTDIKMSGMDGLDLLDEIKSIDPQAVVILITAYSSVDSAVAALRKGAYDYITKPFLNDDLLQTVKNAATQTQLFRENRYLRRELSRRANFDEIVGTSEQLQKVFDLVRKVADTNAVVLLLGESGTGKEMIARSIHNNSVRSDKPFLAVNCGALPESLLESELFGHTKGAFSGAISASKGLFRSATGGTLLLDEIGEMSMPLQVKLLRALQEHEVTPIGSSIPEKFDTRIVAATNKDLVAQIEKGEFREDLYYRLNVIEITMPPLRQRRDDIPILVRHFVDRFRKGGGEPTLITSEAMAALVNYDWPGNVRELENAIERASILNNGEIGVDLLPQKIRELPAVETLDREVFRPTLDEVERTYILEILNSVDDDKTTAAEILGIDLSTLYRKLKRYDD